jgi:hypothetical protein
MPIRADPAFYRERLNTQKVSEKRIKGGLLKNSFYNKRERERERE